MVGFVKDVIGGTVADIGHGFGASPFWEAGALLNGCGADAEM